MALLCAGGSALGATPLDAEGVYWAEMPAGVPPVPLAEAPAPPGAPRVRCELVDYVDCTRDDVQGFRDDGASRLVPLLGETYRVTAPGRDFSWFTYELPCRPTPGRAHLLIAQLPDDRERYTSVTLTYPRDFVWAAPFAGEEGFHPDNQEDDGVRQDVGGAVYTGREIPLTGSAFPYHVLFYPKADRVRVTIGHSGNEEQYSEENGAAVARLWLFAIPDPLPPAPVPAYQGRRVGLYVPHPWYILNHYGCPTRTPEQRRQGLEAFVEYLRFCGLNLLQFHVVNGSDRASRAWFPSTRFEPFPIDLLSELLPLCEAADIEVAPILTPALGGPPERDGRVEGPSGPVGWTRESYQVDRDGQTLVTAFGGCVPDPVRPEVQEFYLGCLEEIARACAPYRCVRQIGIRVNGKIGLCYVSRERGEGAEESGYSDWDLAQFRGETGLPVPETGAYDWLRANAWDAWLDFRCRRVRAFWLRCRDRVREAAPGRAFLVACDLPSETPGTNTDWPAGHSPRNLLRYHGYDPAMCADDEGLVVQRGMMVAAERYFCKWGPPLTHGNNPWAYRLFHLQPEVARLYTTAEPPQAELYHNYWEEAPHPEPEFGPTMRTATASARGWHFLEGATFSLLEANVQSLVFMGWQRATIGHEHEVRTWATRFRSLPWSPLEPTPLEIDSRDGLVRGLRLGEVDVIASADQRGATVTLRDGGQDRATLRLRPFEFVEVPRE